MGKLNSKGFVLVETLVVAAFVAGILAVLYNNLYPLIGEYEKREVYDDIDGKYAAYWIKRVIQHDSVTFSSSQLNALNGSSTSAGYFLFNCDMATIDSMKAMCKEIVEKTQIMINDNGSPSDATDDFPHIYVTRYHLGNRGTGASTVYGFKELIDKSAGFTSGMHKYVRYLPEYTFDSLNGANYRVIVEFHRKHDGNDYLAYSTFEVIK